MPRFNSWSCKIFFIYVYWTDCIFIIFLQAHTIMNCFVFSNSHLFGPLCCWSSFFIFYFWNWFENECIQKGNPHSLQKHPEGMLALCRLSLIHHCLDCQVLSKHKARQDHCGYQGGYGQHYVSESSLFDLSFLPFL